MDGHSRRPVSAGYTSASLSGGRNAGAEGRPICGVDRAGGSALDTAAGWGRRTRWCGYRAAVATMARNGLARPPRHDRAFLLGLENDPRCWTSPRSGANCREDREMVALGVLAD